MLRWRYPHAFHVYHLLTALRPQCRHVSCVCKYSLWCLHKDKIMEKCISGCVFIIKLSLVWQSNVVLAAMGLVSLGCLSGILASGWVWVIHISPRRPGEETEFEVPSVLGSRVGVLPLATLLPLVTGQSQPCLSAQPFFSGSRDLSFSRPQASGTVPWLSPHETLSSFFLKEDGSHLDHTRSKTVYINYYLHRNVKPRF